MQKEKGLRTKIFQVAFRKNSENIFLFQKSMQEVKICLVVGDLNSVTLRIAFEIPAWERVSLNSG